MAGRITTKTPSPPSLADDMKALQDLFTRAPSQARVEQHMERLLAGWQETLEVDAYASRVDELCDGLADGIEQTASALTVAFNPSRTSPRLRMVLP